jgi:UDP-3-O-[3-hydroxymyristoyl] glucosamine N-acyltransferase
VTRRQIPGVLLGESTFVHPSVSVGPGCIIESGVVLGHPGIDDIRGQHFLAAKADTTDDFYRKVRTAQTIIGAYSVIRSGTVIYAGARLGCYLDCGHNVIVRENVTVGDHVYLKNNSEIMRGVVIGDGCRVAGVLADNSVVGNRVSTFGVLTHQYSRYLAPRQPGEAVESEQVAAPTLKDGAIVGRAPSSLGRY